MKPHHRKLQKSYNDAPFDSPITTTSFHNSSSNSNTSSSPLPVKEPYSTKPPPPPPPLQPLQQQYYTNPSFDSSMALTVLVLLTALFFMGFFSIYLRRFSSIDPSEDFASYRHRGSHPASNTPNRPSRVSANSRRGTDPKVVKSLPVYSYYGGNVKYQIECAICLGEFEEKETIKMIPKCEHVFHLECIDTWLKMHVTCPVCRGTQFFHEEAGGGEFGEMQERTDQGMSQGHGISTVENGGTSIELSEVGTLDIRRSNSCSNLGERMLLQRGTSL